jgi:hypothetical protein
MVPRASGLPGLVSERPVLAALLVIVDTLHWLAMLGINP